MGKISKFDAYKLAKKSGAKFNQGKWGKKQDHWRYICPYGHTKYVQIRK